MLLPRDVQLAVSPGIFCVNRRYLGRSVAGPGKNIEKKVKKENMTL